MFSMKMTSTLSLFLFLTTLAVGCGSGTNQDGAADPSKVDLGEIWRVYRMYIKRHQQSPAALSDLKEYQGMFPAALRLLQEGKYVAVWGVKDREAGTVLAYEKDSPSNGGWAVMADGTVKHLDASAFQNVPKPAK